MPCPSCCTPRETELAPTVQEAGWTPGPVWTGAEDIGSQTVQSIMSHYTNYVVPAHTWSDTKQNVWALLQKCLHIDNWWQVLTVAVSAFPSQHYMCNWWACWLNLVLTCQNFILTLHWDFHLNCSQVCSIHVACIGMRHVPDHWCGTACHTCGHTSVHNDMEAYIPLQGSVRSLLHLILQSAHLGVSGMNTKHLKPVYHDVDIGHNTLILNLTSLTMWRVKYSVSHEDSIWHNMPVTVLQWPIKLQILGGWWWWWWWVSVLW